MEVYTNASTADRTVFLEFPVMTNVEIDAHAYADSGESFEFTTLAADLSGQGYNAILPLFMIQFDSRIEIHWSVTYEEPADTNTYTVNKMTPVDVITPILSKKDILAVWDNATPVEVVMIEKAVRHIINAYTGQEFGRFIGTLPVKGTGGTALSLPRRLISISKFNNNLATAAHYSIRSGGYILRHYPWGVPPVKADYHGLHQHVGGVIHNPNSVRFNVFNDELEYQITGHWGWEEVPSAVKEAAKLLVNDYACADAQYRDRYLVSMTAADWRIQHYSGAFLRTGNVRADQLLSDFVVTRGWGII